MNKEMVISVGADGSVSGMHFDAFNLAFLGERDVRRASELIFNEETQLWDIHLVANVQSLDGSRRTSVTEPPIPQAQGFASYEECRDIEVRWLQACTLTGVAPTSYRGVGILEWAKNDHALTVSELSWLSNHVSR